MGRPYIYVKTPDRLGNALLATLLLVGLSGIAALVAYFSGHPGASRQFCAVFLACIAVVLLIGLVQECIDELRRDREELPFTPWPAIGEVYLTDQESQYVGQQVQEAEKRHAAMLQMRRIRLAAAQSGSAKSAPTSQVVIGHPIRKRPH